MIIFVISFTRVRLKPGAEAPTTLFTLIPVMDFARLCSVIELQLMSIILVVLRERPLLVTATPTMPSPLGILSILPQLRYENMTAVPVGIATEQPLLTLEMALPAALLRNMAMVIRFRLPSLMTWLASPTPRVLVTTLVFRSKVVTVTASKNPNTLPPGQHEPYRPLAMVVRVDYSALVAAGHVDTALGCSKTLHIPHGKVVYERSVPSRCRTLSSRDLEARGVDIYYGMVPFERFPYYNGALANTSYCHARFGASSPWKSRTDLLVACCSAVDARVDVRGLATHDTSCTTCF